MKQMPVGEPSPPKSLRKELDEVWAALRAMSVPRQPLNQAPEFRAREIVFSSGNVPVAGQESPTYHVSVPGAYIAEAKIAARGSGSLEVEVLVNDSEVTTLSCSGGGRDIEDDIAIEVEEWDQISVKATTVGEGITAATVQVTLMIPRTGI